MASGNGSKDIILEAKNLHKVYDNGVYALRGVSVSVRRGEFLAIIGLSGSGKSTLLRCFNRLVEPTSGTVHLNGQDITKIAQGPLRRARQHIAMIFQHFNLVKRKSVLTNVMTGKLGSLPTLASILERFSKSDTDRALEKLDIVGLSAKAKNRADELSGGQQQRVAIARALMQDPDILLADEPVASLDPATSHSVMKYLETANKKFGKTIVCNLHFLSLVRQYATRVIALKQGVVVYEGSPQDITEEWFRNIYGDEAVEVQIK